MLCRDFRCCEQTSCSALSLLSICASWCPFCCCLLRPSKYISCAPQFPLGSMGTLWQFHFGTFSVFEAPKNNVGLPLKLRGCVGWRRAKDQYSDETGKAASTKKRSETWEIDAWPMLAYKMQGFSAQHEKS